MQPIQFNSQKWEKCTNLGSKLTFLHVIHLRLVAKTCILITETFIDILKELILTMSSSHETFGLAESENMGFTFKHHLEWFTSATEQAGNDAASLPRPWNKHPIPVDCKSWHWQT